MEKALLLLSYVQANILKAILAGCVVAWEKT